jgi:hypothetical protein
MSLIIPSGVEKAPADLVAWRGPVVKEGPNTYRLLKFIVGSFRMDSILLTEGFVLDSCCETFGVTSLIKAGAHDWLLMLPIIT